MRSALFILCLLVASTSAAQPRAYFPAGSPFLGGVPSGEVTSAPLPLTMADAIGRGLQHNLGLLNAEQRLGRTQGARWEALADLLPNVSGRVSGTRQVLNLAAFGFPLPAGVPSIVGPFNLFDARVTVSQSVVDLKALNTLRAERHNIAAAQYGIKSARDLVVLAAATTYLQALAAAARSASVDAQMQSADALFKQATDMKVGGLVAGIDVVRAEVQLATERQRATAAKNDAAKAKLLVARVVGLPLGQTFTLADELPPVPAPDVTLEQALERAYKTRPDYLAALERVRAAEAERQALTGEYLPSVRVDANYGALGHSPSAAQGTYTVLGAVTVPIFNGGRTRGKLIEAEAELRSRRAEADDVKAKVYYELASELMDLQATSEQLQVATRARALAADQLTQARDRFAAGVSSNIDIVQAQGAVALSSEQYIEALYGYYVTKALVASSIGASDQAVRQTSGGVR